MLARILKFVLGCGFTALAMPTFAALQGTPSETASTAVATITLAIAPSIQISNVGDITLDVTDRNQDVQFEETICVRGNIGSRYSVVAGGQDGGENPFELQTEAGDRIDFELYFRSSLDNSNSDRLLPGERSPYYSMITNNQNCDGNDTAAFTLIFRSEHLLPAMPGIYSGFLTLTVAAE